MQTKIISIDQIQLDGDSQPRVEIHEDLVERYAAAYAAGEKLPPLLVFHDGASYWLVDGYHRRQAAVKAGLTFVLCLVHEATLQNARAFRYTKNRLLASFMG